MQWRKVKRWSVRMILTGKPLVGKAAEAWSRPLIPIYSRSNEWTELQLQSHTPLQGMERGNITRLYLPLSDGTNNRDLFQFVKSRTCLDWSSVCDAVNCGGALLMSQKSLQGPTTLQLPCRLEGGRLAPSVKRSQSPDILHDVTTRDYNL